MSAAAGFRPPVPPPQSAAVRADRVYLGWQYAPLHPDPGPLPRRPAPPATEQVNPGWVAAQRREERRLSRPRKVPCAASAALAGLLLALGLTGLLNYSLTGLGVAVFVAAAAVSGRAIQRSRQDLREQLAAEEQRVEKIREVQRNRLAARQEPQPRQATRGEEPRVALERQPSVAVVRAILARRGRQGRPGGRSAAGLLRAAHHDRGAAPVGEGRRHRARI